MHEQLRAAAEKLQIELPHVESAAEVTRSRIDVAKSAVEERLRQLIGDQATDDCGLDILAFGSMAREEMSRGSDFDYLVIARDLTSGIPTIQHFREAAVHALYQIVAKEPGKSGLFGVMVPAPSLINSIGLNEDTNANMSRRILVLEESVALNEENKRKKLINGILNRYLVDYPKEDPKPLVPRFLMNDVLRYWRTVAVDYQAKRWEEAPDFTNARKRALGDGEEPDLDMKWGLRYMKLRSSRKWTFAGSFISVLMSVIEDRPATAEYFERQFLAMPPLARLAQLHAYFDTDTHAAEHLRNVLTTADWFLERMAVDEWRKMIANVEDPTASDAPPDFKEARDKTGFLQSELERLFFTSDPFNVERELTLGDLSRKYMSF